MFTVTQRKTHQRYQSRMSWMKQGKMEIMTIRMKKGTLADFIKLSKYCVADCCRCAGVYAKLASNKLDPLTM
jgi:hypothetical protein